MQKIFSEANDTGLQQNSATMQGVASYSTDVADYSDS
jgi:hypothetical protein